MSRRRSRTPRAARSAAPERRPKSVQRRDKPACGRDPKSLRRGSRQDYERVMNAVRALADDPRPSASKKMSGREAWRLRVGDHRIIYLIDDEALVATILGVGHRREVYRRN
ncbi:MAG: type II toxin-antitoxin system RelE family toxin [Rubrobacteraceae bacterium]